MKNILKTVAITAAAILATSAAQAVTDTGVITGGSSAITVDSTATFSGGLWTYTYDLVLVGTQSSSGLLSFTVHDPYAGSLAGATVTGNPGTFTGGVGATEVVWNDSDLVDYILGGYSFTSPYAPATGTASGNDNTGYTETSGSVLVPNTPDGGLTASLLGGALLGLGVIRRKIGC
jgi:hypothetical protein